MYIIRRFFSFLPLLSLFLSPHPSFPSLPAVSDLIVSLPPFSHSFKPPANPLLVPEIDQIRSIIIDINMTAAGAGQFGDTTYTKVFVGGLAWETQKDTMKKYFQQFGEILEAVVITDKTTGRSKGYGFVTFREADAAMRACVDAAPVIDGRRANCNLASLGVQRSKPSTPKNGGGGRNVRVMGGFHQAAAAAAFASAATFPHYSIQQGIPYNLYGFSPYSAEYAYPTSYYGVYGGANTQYPLYGSGSNGVLSGGYYPYLNLSEGTGGATSYGVQYPHHLFQYQYYPSHYGTPVSLAPPTPLQSAVCFAVQQA